MSRLKFPISTIAVALLFALAVVISRLRVHLPSPPSNRLAAESEEFQRQGSRQAIHWVADIESALADARRTHRPIMAFLGLSWSTEARQFDEWGLADPEVQALVARYFVCWRADLDTAPHLASIFSPIGRTATAAPPGAQVVFLTPEGNAYKSFQPRIGFIDSNSIQRVLIEAFRDYGTVRKTPEASPNQQAAEREALWSAPYRPDGYDLAYARLRANVDLKGGGFLNGTTAARPHAWRSLLEAGDYDHFRAASKPILESGLVDWLEGGFFASAEGLNLNRVVFDKPTVLTAETMQVLAEAHAATGDKPLAKIARGCFEWLDRLRKEHGGLVPSARIGHTNRFGRSRRSSFYAKDVRDFWSVSGLGSSDARFAREKLGLEPTENHAMTVRIRDWSVLDSPRFAETLKALRRIKSEETEVFARVFRADINGTASAAMMRTGRLLGDADMLKAGTEIYENMERFRIGNDIGHLPDFAGDTPSFLGDYLAYADAALAQFEVRGDRAALAAGSDTLERAAQLFAASTAGVWLATASIDGPVLPSVDCPSIADDLGESHSAKAARLLWSYALLDPGRSKRFSEISAAIVARISAPMPETGRLVCALLNVQRRSAFGGAAFTTGPDALVRATKTARSLPFALVAPDTKVTATSGWLIHRAGERFTETTLGAVRDRLAP